LRGRKTSDPKSHRLPVEERNTPNPKHTWHLFALYLRFVTGHTGDTWHPCTRLLFSVYQARQGTIEAQALALGVAIEGLCKLLFPPTDEDAKQLKEWVRQLRAHCETWTGFADPDARKALFDRLGGLVAQMNGIRAKDILMKLATQGAVYERHVKEWNALRNQAAHTNTQVGTDLQLLIDRCAAVTILLYHLVFKAIGYEGAYTDWSQYGYPESRYRGRWPFHQEIAVAAYYLYLKAPHVHGNDKAHWYEARENLVSGLY
jgi:hypothetical protein